MEALAQIEIHSRDGVVLARVAGEIDISNVAEARRLLTEGVPSSALGLVVDLSNATYLDSSGVHLLFGLAATLQKRRQQLCVVAPEAAPASRVLFLTGFDMVVPTSAGLAEAIAQVRAAPSSAP